MEKRKWLWKRRSSDKSPGGSESSESMSSPSERDSDSQEQFKESPSHSNQSPEVTSKASSNGDDINETVKSLTEKLSAALVNVSAKEELVKQHAKVAEEAVAGWEKAENELAILKEQLDSATKRNLILEDRVGHLDGALKECVRQLRQAREEQEHRMQEAKDKCTQEWKSRNSELENQILELRKKAEDSKPISPSHVDLIEKIEFLEKENLALQLELQQQCEEVEVRTIERDLSTQAAETASKQHLDSIKKLAKLEAECRKLRALTNKISGNDNKSAAASSIYVESLTDSQSDSGDRLNMVEMDTCKSSNSDQWASALIAELDQFKNEKVGTNKNLTPSSIKIDLMDDFLEMERLASLPENSETISAKENSETENSKLRMELEAVINRTVELEEKIEKLEEEKVELQMALVRSQDSGEASQVQLIEALIKLEDVQRDLNVANETKQSMENQISKIEAEALALSSRVDSLEAEVEKEKATSEEFGVKCRSLEEELSRKEEELETLQHLNAKNQPKIKQEDLTAAAGKLVECQKTIVSLKKQLESLATLEDFLIDTSRIPESSAGGLMVPRSNGELWKLHSNETFSSRIETDSMKTATGEIFSASLVKNDNGKSPVSSSACSAISSTQGGSEKNRNGFAKFFSRTKNGIQLEI